jgi:hypothetical protein
LTIRFGNVSLYLCNQQDSWGKYSRKSIWRVRPAVRARCLWSDTSSQGNPYTRRLSHTAHNSSSLPLASSHDGQLIHKKATQRKLLKRPGFFRLFSWIDDPLREVGFSLGNWARSERSLSGTSKHRQSAINSTFCEREERVGS